MENMFLLLLWVALLSTLLGVGAAVCDWVEGRGYERATGADDE